MNVLARWSVLACIALQLCTTETARTQSNLEPRGWVNDFAGVMDAGARSRLEAVLADLERKTGAEVAVVTLPSVAEGDIETAAVDLFERWGIGKKGKDNGVLILCAVKDRRVRIEVGYGLEGILPDARSGRIIDEQMLPHFRAGDLSTGLVDGALAVAGIIAQDAGVDLGGLSVRPGPPRGRQSPLQLALSLLFLVAMVALFIRHPSLFLLMMFMGGGRGYGGFSRGGFGGGFGGFGGGLSGGGGASRGW